VLSATPILKIRLSFTLQRTVARYPPYPTEVSYQLGLELGPLVSVDVFGKPEIAEHLLIQGPGHGGS